MTAGSDRTLRMLIPALLLLGVIYLALRPTLSRMAADAERLDRDTAARQSAAANATTSSNELGALKAAVDKEPGNPALQLKYATMLSQTGRFDDAEQAGLKAAASRPHDAAPRLFLAELQYRTRRYFDAIQTYKAILAFDPSNGQALAGLGWQYILMGWTVEARDFLEKAVKRRPDDPHVKAALALACLQHDDFENSEKQLLDVRRLAPKEADLWEPLVDLYIKWKRYDDAVRVANEALQIAPNNPKVLNGMAQACFRKGDIAGAKQAAERSLAVSSENVLAHYTLGKSLERMNHPDAAIRELESAHKIDPQFEQTSLLLGQLYLRKGRVEEGKRLISEYQARVPQGQKHERVSLHLSMHPSSALDHYQMAEVYMEEKDAPRAIAELRRALEIEPNNGPAQMLLDRAIKMQKGAQG